MAKESDGSDWVALVKGVQHEDKSIPPQTQARIRNALTAELLTRGMPERVQDKIEITFPKSENPSLKIYFSGGTSNVVVPGGVADEDKYNHTDRIAALTDNNDAFQELKRGGKVAVKIGSGYYGRNDVTLSADTTADLVTAVGTMISNPIIKAAFLNQQMGKGPQQG